MYIHPRWSAGDSVSRSVAGVKSAHDKLWLVHLKRSDPRPSAPCCARRHKLHVSLLHKRRRRPYAEYSQMLQMCVRAEIERPRNLDWVPEWWPWVATTRYDFILVVGGPFQVSHSAFRAIRLPSSPTVGLSLMPIPLMGDRVQVIFISCPAAPPQKPAVRTPIMRTSSSS